MKTNKRARIVPSIKEHLESLAEARTLDDDDFIGKRLEALWSALGLFDYTENNLDYAYVFYAEEDAWAFYRHAVWNNPYAMDAFRVDYTEGLGWVVS